MRKENLILVLAFIVIIIFIMAMKGTFNFSGHDVVTKSNVVSIVDGDTIKVDVNGTAKSVRLLGINTPEKGQYYHDEATDRMTQLVYNKSVRLLADPAAPDEDIYGRLLRYVIVNETVVNIIMVEDGYARYYPLNQSLIYGNALEDAEKQAKTENIGIWPMINFSCIGITLFNYYGGNKSNVSGEYVAFKNSCDDPVNLSGWTVINKELDLFTFPNWYLVSGAKIELHSGLGNDSFSKYNSYAYWNKNRSMWNNNHDNLVMYDRDGIVVLNYSY